MRKLLNKNSKFTPAKGWDCIVYDERWSELSFKYNIKTKGIQYFTAMILAKKKHSERIFDKFEIMRLNAKNQIIQNQMISICDDVLSGKLDPVDLLLSGELKKLF